MINLGLNKIIINRINSQNVNYQNNINQGLKVDTVSFTSVDDIEKAKIKMRKAAINLLENDLKLQPKQSMVIRSDKKFLPFLEILSEEAYKRHSGHLYIEINEPELDLLKTKYSKYPDFDWKKDRNRKLANDGAIFIDFNKKNSPYRLAKLTDKEVEKLNKSIDVTLPKDIEDKLSEAFDLEEVFKTCLNVQKGQPIYIDAQREHESQVLKFVEYAYRNGSGPIDVEYTEVGSPLERAKLKYADFELLEKQPDSLSAQWSEYISRQIKRLHLCGEDPNSLAGIDSERVSTNSTAQSNILMPIKKGSLESKYSAYYLPTTMSVQKPYSEHTDRFQALRQAAIDAKKINRCGDIENHINKLNSVAKTMNSQKFDKLHFYSVDPVSGERDDKTDLWIGLSEKSNFLSAQDLTPDGLRNVANTPTEEVYTSPDCTKTEGWVSSTMPLSLDGKVIEGIKLKFENGKIVDAKAETNEDFLRMFIEKNPNADMLGEVALVAGSPIFDTGRVFYEILVDENAACHIALGDSYSETIEGANDISDIEKREEFLRNNNINISNVHKDLMIGGPNVVVDGVTRDGKAITIIKDNKFQI